MDFLVNLYDMEKKDISEKLKANGIVVCRALSPDRGKVLDFMRDNYSQGWVSETANAFTNNPISAYIAVKDHEIVGVACYDATAKGYFGPIGVKPGLKGAGIGQALLYATLDGMREAGYGYGIIGWMDEAVNFYEACVKGFRIPDSDPDKTLYGTLVSRAGNQIK